MTTPGMTLGGKLGLLGTLYFAQGLPFGFFTQALPMILRTQGYSLGAIGLASLLAMPWALKFLWAPLVGRHGGGRGQRKRWILPLQAAAIVALLTLAALPPSSSTVWLMTAVVVLNLIAATQDIATDGLAVDLLAPSERGFGNGVQVAGYRVGMIVGGGALLVLHDRLGASTTFLVMAALIVLASLPVLAVREPDGPPAPVAPVPTPSLHFLRRPGAGRLVAVIVSYKAGESFASGMLRPFLADAGLTLADVGWLIGTVGFVAGLLGALAGGALVQRLGRLRALVTFGLLQAATVGGYAALAFLDLGRGALYALCAVEHFAGGMATAALFTCMMDWCRRDDSATDYTVQASAVVIATGVAAALSGFSAQLLGYRGHFLLATVLTLAAVAVVVRLFPGEEDLR